MSVILVAEQDADYLRQIVSALRSAGWTARTVESRTAALHSAADETPSLVLASSTLPEAEHLLAAFSRGRGGPGSIVLVPEAAAKGISASDYQADEMLTLPCSQEVLRHTVRQCLSISAPAPAPPRRMARQLTSAEIFGDVLAEVEAEAERARKARAQSTSKRVDDDLERRLEETLSGVLSVDEMRKRSRKKAARSQEDDRAEIDDLLDKTLSSLEMPSTVPPPVAETEEERPAQIASPPELDATPAGDLAENRPQEQPWLAPLPPLEAPILEARDEPPESAPLDRVTEDRAEDDLVAEEPIQVVPASSTADVASEDRAVAFDSPPTIAFDSPPQPPRIMVAPRPGDRAAETPVDSLPESSPRAEMPAAVAAADSANDFSSDVRVSDSAERDGQIFQTQPFPIVTERPGPARPEPVEEESSGERREGTPFGDYTLLDRIAVGGMAEVWRARRRGVEGFQKIVAIKKILAHLTDSADFVTMLIDEAKLAAQLSHHNIIQIYDLGKVGDDFFIAMEYVEGKDLRSILNVAREKDSPLPTGLALLIVDAVARALDYAHRKRDFEDRELELVHRDISPQNVLISYEGEIKLCDFGIVKAVSKASTTQMGALKGKLQYMSPEQAWGRSVDARSDIFSLGSVFFELLTGSKLFTGDNEISVLDAVRECRPRSPRELAPAIPKEVESIVLKALAKSPEDRYQRAGDLEHDIKSVLELIKPTPGLKDLASYMDALFRRTGLPASAGPARRPESGRPRSGLPASGHPAAPPTAVPAAAIEARPAAESSNVRSEAQAVQKKTGGGKRIGKLFAAAVLAGVLAGAGYLFLRGPLSESASTAPVPEPEEPAPAAAAAPTEEEGAPTAAKDTTEDAAAAEGVEAAAAGGDPAAADGEDNDPAGSVEEGEDPAALPVDLEQLVAEEVSKRRQELEREFEERKRRLQQEIEEAKRASEQDPGASADDGGGG